FYPFLVIGQKLIDRKSFFVHADQCAYATMQDVSGKNKTDIWVFFDELKPDVFTIIHGFSTSVFPTAVALWQPMVPLSVACTVGVHVSVCVELYHMYEMSGDELICPNQDIVS